MKMFPVIIVTGFLSLGVSFAAEGVLPPSMEQSASVVLQVGDRDVVARQVIAKAEQSGGWFLQWGEWEVTLRVPATQLTAFLGSLDSLGRKVDQTYSTSDQSVSIGNLEASIASRRKLLDSYFAIVKSSNSNQVQTIERAIVDLISQIEMDEGQLRGMQSRIKDALVQVSFRFQDRSLAASTGWSPFPWVNSLNLTEHREKFQ
jgi:hypothetical protein